MNERHRLRVGILFGGRSAEHEVSIESARSIMRSIDPERFDVVPVGIDRDGRWYLTEQSAVMLEEGRRLPNHAASSGEVALMRRDEASALVDVTNSRNRETVDVVFPVLHGPYGEDGSVQGLLKLAGVPYVGADILGSAVGMDKDVMKRLLRDARIPTPAFRTFSCFERNAIRYDELAESLREVLFVKPANLGSSVGINKVRNAVELDAAVDTAFQYDDKIVIESAVDGREIECAVLGNEKPEASVPGEVIPHHEFYSYDAKYIDGDGAELVIPARLDAPTAARIKELAVRTFLALSCAGFARVDAFLEADGSIQINEINTIPGFTQISMFPKLWEASGVPYTELISRLIDLALQRHVREQRRKTTYE